MNTDHRLSFSRLAELIWGIFIHPVHTLRRLRTETQRIAYGLITIVVFAYIH